MLNIEGYVLSADDIAAYNELMDDVEIASEVFLHSHDEAERQRADASRSGSSVILSYDDWDVVRGFAADIGTYLAELRIARRQLGI